MKRPTRKSKRSRQKAVPASKDQYKPVAGKNRNGDWEAIERAVYDGMQDLRVKK